MVLAVEQGPALSDRPERTVRALCEHPLLDATWSRYEAGEPGPDPHVHHEHVDAFYVVEGELQFRVGPDVEPVRAPAGTFVLVPPDVVHAFDNVSDARVRWLNFHAPSTGFVAYLRGDLETFDTDDPPADRGRPAEAVTVSGPRAGGLLGQASQLSAMEVVIDPGRTVEGGGEGVEALFVLEGAIDAGGPLTWMAAMPGERYAVRCTGEAGARLLRLRAPA
jgi:quercetin dioxygenase-like cupin family protein